jgi:GAF domain-containing protein
MATTNIYSNTRVGAVPNPVMAAPDAIDEAFAAAANKVLENTAHLLRCLVGAHQSAAAIVVQNHWGSVRKYFSLSEKYADWHAYSAPATGYGTHGWLLRHNQTVRYTQAELEAHPEWKNFGNQASAHPPMRGWLAAPIKDSTGQNWGLLQLSDKYEGDFTQEYEDNLEKLAQLVSGQLEALWQVRNLQKQAAGIPI